MPNYTLLHIFLSWKIYYVFLPWLLTFSLSINFAVIIVALSTSILIFFLSKIDFRGSLSTKASIEMACTLYMVFHFHFNPTLLYLHCLLQVLFAFNLLVQRSLMLTCGMLGLDTPNIGYYGIFFPSLVHPQILVLLNFVNTVFKARWPNCPFIHLIHQLIFPYKLCAVMFGVLHPLLQ